MGKVRIFLSAGIFLSACALALAQPAPSFTLTGNKGTISLDSLRGHVVYLDFWASWCDPCRKSFPWMNDLLKKCAVQGLVVVAVDLDSKPESADKFLANHPVDFSIAFDPSGSVAKLYNVKAMPSSYIIDREGNIASTHTGFLEKDTKTLEKQVVEQLGK